MNKNITHFLILLFTVLICSGSLLYSQDDKKSENTERAKLRMSLESTQFNGDSIVLTATLKARIDGAWQPVDFEKVSFTNSNDSTSNSLGEILTSDRGIASLKITKENLLRGEDGLWIFGSVFEGNETVMEGESELSIKPAGISISGEKQDSLNSVSLKLFDPGSENSPIAEAEVSLYIKRYFSNLKIGEGTTDENGEVTIEFSDNFPGDSQGIITLIGRADDLEEYGSIAASIDKTWGDPVKEEEQKQIRALWSHAPPLWMVITFAILMTLVWGNYLVIIYKLITIHNNKTS